MNVRTDDSQFFKNLEDEYTIISKEADGVRFTSLFIIKVLK